MEYKRWTPEEDEQLIKMIYNGPKWTTIAQRLGKSVQSCQKRHRKLRDQGKAPVNKREYQPLYEVIKGTEMVARGTIDECIKQMGISKETFYNYRRDEYRNRPTLEGYDVNIVGRVAKKRRTFEWSPSKEERLLDMRDKGYSFERIADELGCSPGAADSKFKKLLYRKNGGRKPRKKNVYMVFDRNKKIAEGTVEECAKQLNKSHSQIYQYARSYQEHMQRIRKDINAMPKTRYTAVVKGTTDQIRRYRK